MEAMDTATDLPSAPPSALRAPDLRKNGSLNLKPSGPLLTDE